MSEPRTAIFERRESLKDRPVKHEWPSFLVSAAHAVTADAGSPYPGRPYGVWHARRVGALRSACGMSAVNWRFFWRLRFDPADAEVCRDCVAAVRDTVFASQE